MSDLQKIVVLCLVGLVLVGTFFFSLTKEEDPDNDANTQIDPPSLELDTAPEDIDPEPEIPENEPGDTVVSPDDVGMEFPIPDDESALVACTQEARQCPDGSYVGRTGPRCEFAACPEVPSSDPATAAHVVDVSGVNFAFDVPEIRVKEGDTVTINFTSAEGFHDWVVDEFDAATERVRDGGQTSVTFVAGAAGTYEYYCSVGNHRALGMVGTLIVE